MKKPMRISLRAGEQIYINGAVLRVDRKVTVELVNEVMFLLEGQVMQAADATTALRQLYFIVQFMLMNPTDHQAAQTIYLVKISGQQEQVLTTVTPDKLPPIGSCQVK